MLGFSEDIYIAHIVNALITLFSLWVYYDAKNHKIGKIAHKKSFLNISAGAWSISVLLLVIVSMPAYLFFRSKLIEQAKEHPSADKSNPIYLVIGIVVWGAIAGYYNMGSFYLAKDFYENLSNQRESLYQYEMGLDYEFGENGYTQNNKLAVEWYRKSAEQEYTYGEYAFGVMYLRGKGVPQNFEKAFEWINRAAVKGHVMAQANLALMYISGDGVSKNETQGYAWLALAAHQGSDMAKRVLANAKKKTEPIILEEAKLLSKEYYELYVKPFQNK